MATADTQNTKTPLDDLTSTGQFVFTGLVWGAVMLCTLGAWLRTKYDASAMIWANVFLFAAATAAVLAIWQAFTLWIQKEPADQKTATLTQQKRILSLVLMAAGFGLIVMAFVVGIGKKPGGGTGFLLDNLPESFGVMLFGLIALGGGYALSAPPAGKIATAAFIPWLTQSIPIMKLGMIALDLIAIPAFAYMMWYAKVPAGEWWPEYLALILFSVLCFACFLCLNSGVFDEVGTRLFVLVFGGAVGLICFVTILFRAYLWRQDIYLGGSEAWQGPTAWRFWVCAYGLFAALVLIFASLNVSRADIRTNVILRRALFGYDALAQAFLLIGILFVFNVVVYARFPFTFDWTKTRGAYSLSDSSKFLISKLKQEANVFVLMPQNDPVYKDLRVLLDNCSAINNKFKVNYISPGLDEQEYVKLAKKFPVILPDPGRGGGGKGVLLVYGPMPKEDKHATPHAFVAETKISAMDEDQRGGRPKRLFKGESEILKELKFLAQEQKKRKIYFLTGHDELNVNNMGGNLRRDIRDGFGAVGIGFWADRLKKENYDIFALSFGLEIPNKKETNIVFAQEEGAEKKKEVPIDCHTLVIAGASKKLSTEELGAIERYMARDGKMVVFLDVVAESDFAKMKETGLEPLLKTFGVDVTNDFALRLAVDDAAVLLATTPKESDNPLARQFVEEAIIMKNTARIVRPAEGAPGRFKAETIIQLEPDMQRQLFFVVEKDVRILRDPEAFITDLRRDRKKLIAAVAPGPVSVAVAVTEGKENKPRMVVFGDTEFITNFELVRSQTRLVNHAMALGALEWMAEREAMIGTQPKVTAWYQLGATADVARMIFLPGWLMLLTLISLGVGIWVVRRR